MQQKKELSMVRETGKNMISLLGLSASSVGVKLVFKDDKWDNPSAERLPHHRYCRPPVWIQPLSPTWNAG